MKAFLFVFDQSKISREITIRSVNQIQGVKNWYAIFGNTMILATELSSAELSDLIRQSCPDLTFLVSEINPSTKAGWLPDVVWRFINDPRPVTVEHA